PPLFEVDASFREDFVVGREGDRIARALDSNPTNRTEKSDGVVLCAVPLEVRGDELFASTVLERGGAGLRQRLEHGCDDGTILPGNGLTEPLVSRELLGCAKGLRTADVEGA